MKLKRWIALWLVLVLLVCALPPAAASEPVDVWDQIKTLEQACLATRGSGSLPEPAAFADLTDTVELLVQQSPTYAPGTLERHGDFLFWQSLDGTANGYSPDLRARLYRESVNSEADPAAFSAVETVSFAARGNTNGSVSVAVFQPYYGLDSSFKKTYVEEGKKIASATGGTCTAYLTDTATIDAVAQAMQSCGVVLLDSHGNTDYSGKNGDQTSRANSSYLCLQCGHGITARDMEPVKGSYGTYYHAFYGGHNGKMQYYLVDGTAIANHMTERSPNTLVWMAICLGMATKGMQKPLRSKGAGVVYGYSQSVSFTGDYMYADAFWTAMRAGSTAGEAFAEMKDEAGCVWDPVYAAYYGSVAEAKKHHAAFPILVSAEDPYPGKGNVDAVQTPKSTWTLVNPYLGCEDCPGRAFTDMPAKDTWAHDPIDWAVTNGITTGTSETTFSPENICTRGQVVTFLWRAKGQPEPVSLNSARRDGNLPSAGEQGSPLQSSDERTAVSDGSPVQNPFRDVKETDYFYKAVLWAAENGITTGTAPGKFSPNDNCTRGQVVTFLFRTLATQEAVEDQEDPENPEEPDEHGIVFTDVAEDSYYYAAVLWAVEQGVTSGVSDTQFAPEDPCTRAHIVTFLYRAMAETQ